MEVWRGMTIRHFTIELCGGISKNIAINRRRQLYSFLLPWQTILIGADGVPRIVQRDLLRTMVAHWQDNNHTNPQEWGTGMEKIGQLDQRSFGLISCILIPGIKGCQFDTPTDVKCYSMIDNNETRWEIIRVGESWRTYINEQSISNKVHMTDSAYDDNNGNRNEWFLRLHKEDPYPGNKPDRKSGICFLYGEWKV